MVWSRPVGPPLVWSVIELIDSAGEKRKFSLQEIPEERYEEALCHMCSIFVKDETICRAMGVINDPQSIETGRKLWGQALSQGISVAAFEITKEDAEPTLAGMNVLVYVDEETDKAMKSLEGKSKFADLLRYVMTVSALADPRKIYMVDKYLSALGLSVKPEYRRLGLGQKLLELRDGIGKKYGIEYTSTVFSSPTSQSLAKKVGFKTDLECPYEEALHEDGTPLLPTLKGKSCKIMSKRIA
ncbi:PREDICTED: uncharacterized protein LOC108358428 [Rhagoletis zephyria]|uniref:uncharacterized protein LOC108358428 n=1 Tax=Rhagoletis zephyria TaxID=28612 RepID=UPI00081155F3|nr:PREDICTED: uncharacterized protein LOC108358428 [Rhagoletis zephyria]